ncbi:hypothetical protein LTR62_004333 [Meristemomyces frigidus]|uniref:C3H1-type domain-containing protein n=1 Tax=Meristemomyces frigidus TaxID=1508187 RepID=A0AAN7TET9_9PEZI|nr:hypothetical protein LTR62_004333 [Meristemomyces frigidus]
MPLDEEDTGLFKNWVTKELAKVSDADSEVLADYIVALVSAADDAASVSDALDDFIPGKAKRFVDDVFQAIATRSYDPAQRLRTSKAPPPPFPGAITNGLATAPRKRSYHDWDDEHMQNRFNTAIASGNRPPKQPRRGGRLSNMQDSGQVHGRAVGHSQRQGQGMLGMDWPRPPTPPPGIPAFDLHNPMVSFLAMQQAMGMVTNGPNITTYGPASRSVHKTSRRRCRDYDTKGFCTRGTSCLYEHGDNAYVVPDPNDEYHPSDALMFAPVPAQTSDHDLSHISHSDSKRGGRSNGKGRKNGERASFSMVGPNKHDTSLTSLVVEHIPRDHFNKHVIENFFSQFGPIDHISVQEGKYLAIVKYTSYESANAAWRSPKCIFDNRFVKVYWYKPDQMQQATDFNSNKEGDVEMIINDQEFDLEEVARTQEEAQKKHDAAKAQREVVERRRHELKEKLMAVNQERQQTLRLLAKAQKSGHQSNPSEDYETLMLKQKLDELKSEAKSLGIDPEADDHQPYADSTFSSPASRGSGRGGFRGRSRGRGQYASPRGAGHDGTKSTLSLDNRPKTIAVTFAEGEYSNHEEALRQHLTFNGMDSAVLMAHPSQEHTALIAFQQRYEGENFMATAPSFKQQIGQSTFAWYKPGDNVAVQGESGNGGRAREVVGVEVGEPRQEERDMDTYDEGEEVL